jgi:hypothetical protein
MSIVKKYLNERESKIVRDPFLSFKKITGLGDLFAILLHSKFIGFFIYLITGQIEPCLKCQKRRYALNILFPLPIWKIFYKNYENFSNKIKEEFNQSPIENQYDTEQIENILKEIEENQVKIKNFENQKIYHSPQDEDFFKNYKLITEYNNQHESFYISTRIYQKNEQPN